jgi:hypothetical protein
VEEAGIMGESLRLRSPVLATWAIVRPHVMRPRSPALGRETFEQHGRPSESAASPQLAKRAPSVGVMQPASDADETAADPKIYSAFSPQTDTPSSPARSPPSLPVALGSECRKGECLDKEPTHGETSHPVVTPQRDAA